MKSWILAYLQACISCLNFIFNVFDISYINLLYITILNLKSNGLTITCHFELHDIQIPHQDS